MNAKDIKATTMHVWVLQLQPHAPGPAVPVRASYTAATLHSLLGIEVAQAEPKAVVFPPASPFAGMRIPVRNAAGAYLTMPDGPLCVSDMGNEESWASHGRKIFNDLTARLQFI